MVEYRYKLVLTTSRKIRLCTVCAAHQANGDNETWTGLAPVLRQAAIISGDTKYEDAIQLLPWAKEDWPGSKQC